MLNRVIYKIKVNDLPRIITLVELSKLKGFQSVYLQSLEIDRYLEENSGSLEGYTDTNPVVGSLKFYVDFDDNDEAAIKFSKYLDEKGIGYKMYSTGGRGYHFHVNREYVESKNLPYSDKEFAKYNIPGADLLLYKHIGVFRIPGTIHEKTGEEKKLYKEAKGDNIIIPLREKPITEYIQRQENTNIFSDRIIFNSVMGFSQGRRHLNIFKLISALREKGMTEDFIKVFVEAVNYQSLPPLDEIELCKFVDRNLKK